MEEDVRKWFEKAESDYELADDNLNIDNIGASMFFSHQAAEKALKALQISREGEKTLSHNLVSISGNLNIPTQHEDLMAELTPFYTGFRYPDEDSPEVDNPERIFKQVGELLQWIKKQLKK